MHAATEPAEPGLLFDPLAPGYFDDPYAHYRALQVHDPVHREPRTGAWIVTRYADVQRLVRDRSLAVELRRAATLPAIEAERARHAAVATGTDKWMLFRDGEDHTRLRRLVATVFTARAVAGWRHRTEEIVADLLDEAAERGRFDVVTDYAHVLPARIVSELIGLPDDDLPDLIRLSSAVTRSFESLLTPEQEAEALSATRELAGLLGEVLDAAARRPSTGLLDDLLAAEDGGDHLSRDDVIAQVTMLIAAGHETVGNLVGTGLLHLLEHPDQLALLRDDPSLDGPAVDELLRFDAPVQLTRRFAVSPIELHGTTIPVGGDVILGLGAANRDPAKWGPTADAVDLCRPGADEHLSFGGGAHYCMGAALGRLECAIALPGLVRRFPDLVPGTDRPAWVQRMVLRGLERFPVTV